MAVSAGFRTWALEQLAPLGATARGMFGGAGLYADGLFFGLIDDDVLYLKVNETTRPDFERAGARPFRPYPDRPDYVMAGYYEVPAAVLDDRDELVAWARRALDVARSSSGPRRPAKRGRRR